MSGIFTFYLVAHSGVLMASGCATVRAGDPISKAVGVGTYLAGALCLIWAFSGV